MSHANRAGAAASSGDPSATARATPKLVVLTVGQKDQILLGYPDHPVKLTELVKGPLKDVPLRDPLTMKPLSQ